MKIALLITFALGVVLYVVFGLRSKLNSPAPTDKKGGDCEGGDSCGVSCFCDDAALRRRLSEEIVYFDDEELDAYKGIAPQDYTPAQTEEFSEVLTTLRPDEIADWLHSLQLRGISLPDALRDEATIMMEQ